MKKKFTQSVSRLLVLFVSWFIVRYPLLHLHGMHQWPMFLLVIGIPVVVGSTFAGCRILPDMVSPAYLIGFFLAHFTQNTGFDPGGGATSDLWIRWLIFYILCMLIGLGMDLRQHNLRK